MATPITSKGYNIGEYHRGYGVIIVNTFRDESGCERKGAEVEIQNLTSLFEYLGLEIKRCTDVTAKQILQSLTELSRSNDLFDHSVLVVAISSHGNAHGLYGADSDGEEGPNLVTDEQVNSIFSSENCRHLVGHPKVFIFNACRVYEDDVTIQRIVDNTRIQETVFTDEQSFKPRKRGTRNSDIFNVYSCLEGHVSNRSTTRGSVFISILCETWRELGNDNSLPDIVTELNGRLIENCTVQDADNEGTHLSQCCQSYSTLTAVLRIGGCKREVFEKDMKPDKGRPIRRSASYVKSKRKSIKVKKDQPLMPVKKEDHSIGSVSRLSRIDLSPEYEDTKTESAQSEVNYSVETMNYPIQARPDYLMQTIPAYFTRFIQKFVSTPPKSPTQTTPKIPIQSVQKDPIQTLPKDLKQNLPVDLMQATPNQLLRDLPQDLVDISLKDLTESHSPQTETSEELIVNPLRDLIEISLKQMSDIPLKDLIGSLPKNLVETPLKDLMETTFKDLVESPSDDLIEDPIDEDPTESVETKPHSTHTEFFLCGTGFDEVNTVYVADAANARVWCYDVTQEQIPGYIYDPLFATHQPYAVVADRDLVIVTCGTTLLAFDARTLMKVEEYHNKLANFSGIDISMGKVYAASNLLSFAIYRGSYSLHMQQMSLSLQGSDLKRDMYLADLKASEYFLILLFGNTTNPLCVFDIEGVFLEVILQTPLAQSYKFLTMDHINENIILGEETNSHIMIINLKNKVWSMYAYPQLEGYSLGGVSLLAPELLFVAVNTDKKTADLSEQCLRLKL